MGVGGQRHAPVALLPRMSPGTHCTVSSVGPKIGLDGCREKKISCLVASRYPDLCTHFTVDTVRVSVVYQLYRLNRLKKGIK